MNGRIHSGKIVFYCPADEDKDTVLELLPDSNGQQQIAIGKNILPAAYKVRVSWQANDTSYYQETFMNLQ